MCVFGRWVGLGQLLFGHSVALFVFAAEAGEGEGVGFDAVAGAAEQGSVVQVVAAAVGAGADVVQLQV